MVSLALIDGIVTCEKIDSQSLFRCPKLAVRKRNGHDEVGRAQQVLSKRYGAFADCAGNSRTRRPPSTDARTSLKSLRDVPRRRSVRGCCSRIILKNCRSQRRDFPDTHWWPRLRMSRQGAPGGTRVFCFSAPNVPYRPNCRCMPSPGRFARAEEAEKEQNLVIGTRKLAVAARAAAARHAARHAPRRLPRATGRRRAVAPPPGRAISLLRPRTGEKARTLRDLIDLVVRATHEQELFSPADWEFIQWLADTHPPTRRADTLVLSDAETAPMASRAGTLAPPGM